MTAPEMTVESVTQLLHICLEKQDIEGVGHCLRWIAVRDPQRADHLRNLMLLGLDIAQTERGAS